MPNVVHYVPAAKWRALEAEGEDPAALVRKLASDALDRHLAGSIEGSRTLVDTPDVHTVRDGSGKIVDEVRTDFKGGKR